ncbi:MULTISPECIES: LLM class flavin-dependent oxidoreductase [Rossellomorea]|uniref:LLM class flavin-dependent oxidoreductase n=1 Tax=Rossellomorea TaxID=2837508 RepID=UPI001CCF3330|nr:MULTISPECIES: LLM class flavin-dependent oxidoreductase [Rossellomorea]MCA0150921.1 LLM class flavin-dependent oxidoreductase [Rossellomorea vietnamensis]UTE76971.1 LLM class flavin-dependent oxidoreductase [Rossellomorea sp. KS-H15a]WGG44884.1 LLM class flavin-dependent oxidoreductase [Rossellomorea sp. DA94]
MSILKLSVLDQSPIAEGMSPQEALNNTVELAKHTEKLGFERFWVSEHHDSTSLAGSSPEVLIAHLAQNTSRIRVGSGGVMLPHYSSYKVAENFRLLEGLNPNRIDLGLGRAPGGMPMATMALHDGKPRDVNRYPEQIDDLLGYLTDSLPDAHPYQGLTAAPMIKTMPEVWMLGSSPSSAMLAAQKGLPYTFAQFINGEGGPQYTQAYRNNFVPSEYLKEPKNIVAVFAICAETDEEAERVASSIDLSILMIEQGMRSNGTPSPEKAAAYQYTPFEAMRVRENRKRMVVGGPKKVKEKLLALSEQYQTDEIMLVSITYDFKDKLKSFELIANELL